MSAPRAPLEAGKREDAREREEAASQGGARERILLAGVSQFQACGYAASGVTAILAQARAPKGSFYHHFPGGKEQLAVEATAWLAAEVNRYLDGLAASGSGGGAMTLGMAGYAARGVARTHQTRGSLVAVLAAEAAPGSPAIAAALRQAVEGWIERLASGFALDGCADPRARARDALAAVEGATVLARIAGSPNLGVEITRSLLAHSAGGPASG